MFFSKILPRNVSEIAKLKVHVLKAFNQSCSSMVQFLVQNPEKLEPSNHQAGPGVLTFAEALTSQAVLAPGRGSVVTGERAALALGP